MSMFKTGQFLWIKGDCFDTGWIGPPDWPAEPKKVEPFKITGPGRYRCRDGSVAKIEGSNTGSAYVWYGHCGSSFDTWTNDGTHCISKGPTGFDIVASLSDEPQPAKPRQWWIKEWCGTKDSVSKLPLVGCTHVVEASVLRKIAEIAVNPCSCCRGKANFDAIRKICREVLGDDAS